ncbi:MAG: lysophospholipid acyltransferase family protein [Rikenellaceae bacterium]
MKHLGYYLSIPFIYLLGKMPYKMQYILSDFMRFMLYKVVRYRVGVVRENLQKSFPEKSVEELRTVERNYYKHLADTFVETLSLTFATEAQIKKRMVFLNADQLDQHFGGRSFISAMAHYGSWEYASSFGLHYQGDKVIAAYRPLSSFTADRIYKKMRTRFGTNPLPMKEITKAIITGVKQQRQYAIALISDQNPPIYEQQIWLDFFGRKTLFYGGVEKLAVKFNLPVFFLHMDKSKRGHYIAWFELLYDGSEEVEPHEVTRRYAQKLEREVCRRPELWIWSHRRWKHRYEDHQPSVSHQTSQI